MEVIQKEGEGLTDSLQDNPNKMLSDYLPPLTVAQKEEKEEMPKLDDKPNRIELQHSRIKGKRIVMINGKEMSNSSEYTYSYSFSFPIDKHYVTIIQISPDQYDLRIDNLSFASNVIWSII